MRKQGSKFEQLKNLGPKSQEWLHSIGIYSKDDIEKMGPFKIYRILEKAGYPVSLNLMYALIGALQDLHWTLIKENMKEQIIKELEQTKL